MNSRNEIIKKLYDYVGIPVVSNQQDSKRPKFPFIGYTVINVDKTEASYRDLSLVPGTDFEFDIKNAMKLQVISTMSVTAYSNNQDEAYFKAKLARHFFINGFNESTASFVVVDVLPLENRSVIEVDKYVHSYGFDVIIRTEESVEKLTPTIENYNILKKED